MRVKVISGPTHEIGAKLNEFLQTQKDLIDVKFVNTLTPIGVKPTNEAPQKDLIDVKFVNTVIFPSGEGVLVFLFYEPKILEG